jgi:transcription initiation factor TFIIB
MYTRAIKLIKRYCDLLDLRDNIIRQVEEIYYEIQDKQDLKGKRLEIVIAACIYLACKRNLVNIHPTALEPLADVNQAKILKMSKIILKFIPMVTIHASEYIQLFCSKLQVSNEHTQDMIKLCKEIESYDFFDMQLPKPRTIAAAVIYFFLSKQDPKFRKSLQEIKEVAGILTDNTIKKYYHIMQEKQSFFSNFVNSMEATQ